MKTKQQANETLMREANEPILYSLEERAEDAETIWDAVMAAETAWERHYDLVASLDH